MVELRYLKEEINVGDGIDYEAKIITKLQYRNMKQGFYATKTWDEWKDIPEFWVNTETTKNK